MVFNKMNFSQVVLLRPL